MSDFINSVLRLASKYEFHDDLFWTADLRFFVKCNDLFWWATADMEEITPDTLAELEKAYKDHAHYGDVLYCCRRRSMRPQGAFYRDFNESIWDVFDACGPERPVKHGPFGNPKAQPKS